MKGNVRICIMKTVFSRQQKVNDTVASTFQTGVLSQCTLSSTEILKKVISNYLCTKLTFLNSDVSDWWFTQFSNLLS